MKKERRLRAARQAPQCCSRGIDAQDEFKAMIGHGRKGGETSRACTCVGAGRCSCAELPHNGVVARGRRVVPSEPAPRG